MPTEQVITRTRTLRALEVFDAPQVEGPIRLFDEQDILPVNSGPPLLSRTFRMTLAVERYSQIQTWRMDNSEDPVSVEQLSKDTRFRDSGFVNADLSLESDSSALDIPHSRDRVASDPIADPDHQLPRSKSVRIPGGYIQLHGAVGRASRYIKYPDEV